MLSAIRAGHDAARDGPRVRHARSGAGIAQRGRDGWQQLGPTQSAARVLGPQALLPKKAIYGVIDK